MGTFCEVLGAEGAHFLKQLVCSRTQISTFFICVLGENRTRITSFGGLYSIR